MKILFISSGNTELGISTVVLNQGTSLMEAGEKVDFFTLNGKGFKGYLKNVSKLRCHIKNNQYDIYHAHYSLSAFVAALAGCRPLIVSLMGSDVNESRLLRLLIHVNIRFFWNVCIVKSTDMAKKIKPSKVHIIPNGVNFNLFKELNKHDSQQKVGFEPDKKHVIFVGNPARVEKNYQLAREAIVLMTNPSVRLHTIFNVSNEIIPTYMNAADCLLLTSLWEGSPNVIKEAMACNCPIVSTDVGDVREVIGDTEGCFITSFDPADAAEKIKLALDLNKRTNGRNKIQHLASDVIAEKIIQIYQSVLTK